MEVATKAPLWRYTTLKVGGDADHFAQPARVDELVELLDNLKQSGEPWHVLGGGSNMLISSEGVPGTVIRTAQMTRISQIDANILDADAGTRLPHLAKYAAQIGLAGLEFAVGIPGTVGGAMVMNAGAHGSSMSEITESVTVFDTTKWKLVTLTPEEMRFEYRRSGIDPSKQIVVSARLRLRSDLAENIVERTKHNEEYRWRTQPLGWPNAGSTFKNPEPTRTAGFLLDQSGAKELKEGSAAVSAVHANFVVNLGGATSQDVTALLRKMQDTVYEKFSLHLHPEWKTMGTFSQAEQEIWNR